MLILLKTVGWVFTFDNNTDADCCLSDNRGYWLKVRGKMRVGSVVAMGAETSLAVEAAGLIYTNRE